MTLQSKNLVKNRTNITTMAERGSLLSYEMVARTLVAMHQEPQVVTTEILFLIVPGILNVRERNNLTISDSYNHLIVGPSSHIYLTHELYPLKRESQIDLFPTVPEHPRTTLLLRKERLTAQAELFLIDSQNGEEKSATLDHINLPFLTRELLMGFIHTPPAPGRN